MLVYQRISSCLGRTSKNGCGVWSVSALENYYGMEYAEKPQRNVPDLWPDFPR